MKKEKIIFKIILFPITCLLMGISAIWWLLKESFVSFFKEANNQINNLWEGLTKKN